MPLSRALQLCPHAVFLPVNHKRYSDASHQIEQIFRSFSPQVEMVSVDEAYIDLTGAERLWGHPIEAATRLHEEVRRKTSLPCSIGVSTSRLVSKVASDQAKPNGLLAVLPGREAAFLAPMPVRRIPGIGKATEARLEQLGIKTVAAVARAGGDLLEQVFGAYGAALFRKSAGEDAGGWFEGDIGDEGDPKSIGHETTFDEDTADARVLSATLSELAQMVGHRLRQHRLFARTVTLKLRDATFNTITRARTLPGPSDLDLDLFRTADELFRANWKGGKVRLVGVTASGLERREGQLDLLENERRQKWQKALEAADRLRSRFGFDSVRLAGGITRHEDAKARRQEDEE